MFYFYRFQKLTLQVYYQVHPDPYARLLKTNFVKNTIFILYVI